MYVFVYFIYIYIYIYIYICLYNYICKYKIYVSFYFNNKKNKISFCIKKYNTKNYISIKFTQNLIPEDSIQDTHTHKS